MTSPTSNEASSYSSSYNKLIRKALRLARRARRGSVREQAFAQRVAETQLQLDEARRKASIGDSGDTTPAEIKQVMRAPKGVDRTVVVYHDGMTIKASIHPLGVRNLEREAEVWRCIRETAVSVRGQKA